MLSENEHAQNDVVLIDRFYLLLWQYIIDSYEYVVVCTALSMANIFKTIKYAVSGIVDS